MLRRTSPVATQHNQSFLALRAAKLSELNRLPELHQANKFLDELRKNKFHGVFTTRGGKKPRPISDLIEYHGGGQTEGISPRQIDSALTAAFATFTLAVESRVASALGKGFYTIGPCGEELLSPIGLVLRPTDPVALHYRHLAPSIARRFRAAEGGGVASSSALDSVLFDRAKGYTVSSTDPVCGGHHCCLGGGDADFLVTSTLASQSCPALGRAMGIPLSNRLLPHSRQHHMLPQGDGSHLPTPRFPPDAVSFVTLGDGSINNSHFLSALNLADYATHRSFKVPVVFCITDNDICISLRGQGFVNKFLERGAGARFPAHVGLGSDLVDTWLTADAAVSAARRTKKPQLLILQDITRRFGHAATDRQNAYMSKEEIQAWADRNPLLGMCEALVEHGLYTNKDLAERFESTWAATKEAFAKADVEPKISTRAQVSRWNAADLLDMSLVAPGSAAHEIGKTRLDASEAAPVTYTKPKSLELFNFGPSVQSKDAPAGSTETSGSGKQQAATSTSSTSATSTAAAATTTSPYVYKGVLPKRSAKTHIMRKHMNKVFDELLSCEEYRDVVYIGEDVCHGGYYLITEGLHKKHPSRVLDFPPDETSLIGAALGFSQAGLTPICEIPYAKYLDCGFDAFTEAVIMHWLSRGKERNGVVFRLQGFGRGVFGGNYHTHNMLHIPPGLDVVCCSRGDDYARMMRYAISQARAGRMIMFVDTTELLNMREVPLGERPAKGVPEGAEPPATCWEFPYSEENEYIGLDDVTVYRSSTRDGAKHHKKKSATDPVKKIAVVTYGNGLVAALEADLAHNSRMLDVHSAYECDIIDCRCLSHVPQGLKDALYSTAYDAVLFADPCKFGSHPLNMHFAMFVNWKANGKAQGVKQLPVGKMKSIGAEFTYNPLGTKLTFLNATDIVDGLLPLLRD